MTSKDRLRRNEWAVVPLATTADAIDFLQRYHYAKGGGKASLYRHGLYRREEGVWPLVGELMGVAIWQPPLMGVGATVGVEGTVLVLSRLCVHPAAPKNAASFLLAGSMHLIDRQRWPTLLTYADTRLGHTGAIYKATNWMLVGETTHQRTWTDDSGVQRGQKRGDTALSSEEMRRAGYTRTPGAPKLKFVHGVYAPGKFTRPRRQVRHIGEAALFDLGSAVDSP